MLENPGNVGRNYIKLLKYADETIIFESDLVVGNFRFIFLVAQSVTGIYEVT